jgi:phosphatidylserine/phosphatidylglycerophosphate/cardiolipin synthase-like enzyme
MASLPVRFAGTFLTGRALYEEVIRDGVLAAKRSVWIATANVKELYVERSRRYGSVLRSFDDLVSRGVELRMLHAEVPSRRFRAAFDRHPQLVKGGLAMKHCPRNHLKAVIIDGSKLYLGSANFTGAGLGAKGDDKRNFEFGFLTEDFRLLDEVQSLFQMLWAGEPCATCAVRAECPDPGPYFKR